MKRSLLLLLVACTACIGAIVGSIFTMKFIDLGPTYTSIQERQSLKLINYTSDSANRSINAINFQPAAKKVTPGVVHIQTVYGLGKFSINALDNYLNPHAQSSGSGVIISDDGYIVTNYHVIEGASSIEVILNNNQHFYAKVIGTDQSTDLALLKIKAHNLPFVKYGDSDRVTIGEWVLAIGNPFDLNSTVTAGIVSAKARNIRILEAKNNLQVESFIQTDAAVNPGNSGGALVNLQGDLVGINTAIATSTGAYSGYSFAIPVNLVKKIMDDLLEFGQVQRGLLGVQIENVNAELAEELNLNVVQGVIVGGVNENSSAKDAGIQSGDVIIKINNQEVNNVSELQERVAINRPGQKINVSFLREGQLHEVKAILKNYEGSEKLLEREFHDEIEGATFSDIPYAKLNELGIDGGVLIKKLSFGKWKRAGLTEEFIITHIDKAPIDNIRDLNLVMETKRGGVLVEGLFVNGEKGTIGLEW